MRRLALIRPASLVVFIAISCNVLTATDAKPARVHSAWDSLRPGDYLRAEYIRGVCRTRSPYAARMRMEKIRNSNISQISIEQSNEGLSVGIGWNFHEGNSGYSPAKDGKLQVEGTTYAISVHSPTEFELSDGKSTIRFRYVGDWQNWANRAVIAGTYVDSHGRKYVFESNGRAVFPHAQFDYEVGLDMILTSYDYIYSKNDQRMWAVRASSKAIALYPVDNSGPDPEGVIARRPQWRLKRISPLATCQ